MPISGKPEIGGAPRNDGEEFFRSLLSLKPLILRLRRDCCGHAAGFDATRRLLLYRSVVLDTSAQRGPRKSSDFSASTREAFMHRSWLFGVAAAFSIIALAPSSVRAQEDFYKGKTISIVIGAKTGSLAIGAQLVGRHLD